jgi:hypothetical protein
MAGTGMFGVGQLERAEWAILLVRGEARQNRLQITGDAAVSHLPASPT